MQADFEVWPENWPAACLFCELDGQWRRAGMSGVKVAMDYAVLFARMRQIGLVGQAREDMFQLVRVMEQAALEQMAVSNDD